MKFSQVVGAAVGKLAFELVPDAFVWVEFWSICREALKVQTMTPPAELSHMVSLMGSAVVPDDNNMPAQVAKQMAKEPAGLLLLDVLFMELKIKADALALRAESEGRNRRDAGVIVPVPGDRGLAARGPCPADARYQEEPRFIDEGDVGAQPRGVFFMRGHSFFFQASMALSSRSTALLSGFWELQPIECSNLPMWSLWYPTPNFASMSWAIRAVVHRSVRYPCASGPSSKYSAKIHRCSALNRVGLPGVGLDFKADFPPACSASRHLITELASQPIRLATSFSDKPFFTSATALRLRRSNSSAAPFGRMATSSMSRVPAYCITCAEVNNGIPLRRLQTRFLAHRGFRHEAAKPPYGRLDGFGDDHLGW